MRTGIKLVALVWGVGLSGCAFEPISTDDLEDTGAQSEEDVGSTSSAVNVFPLYRPAAAAVMRGVRYSLGGFPRSRQDLYVFICDAGQVKYRVKGLTSFSDWTTVPSAYRCDTAPTVGVIRNTTANAQDVLAVYWRSNTKLIELWLNENGGFLVTNLLDYDPVSAPEILGAPLVVDTSDPTKVQVVTRRLDDELWTVAWTGSRYEARPIYRANGTIFTAQGTYFNAVYNAGNGREYITTADGFDEIVFSRGPASWHKSYTEYARATGGTHGLLTIAGRSLPNGQTCASGYAIKINFSTEASCLDPGGTLTNWTEIAPLEVDTLFGAPNGSEWAFGLRNSKLVAFTTNPLNYAYDTPWNVQGVSSAVVQPANGGDYAFWASSSGHLMVADYTRSAVDVRGATVTDLGGNLRW